MENNEYKKERVTSMQTAIKGVGYVPQILSDSIHLKYCDFNTTQ